MNDLPWPLMERTDGWDGSDDMCLEVLHDGLFLRMLPWPIPGWDKILAVSVKCVRAMGPEWTRRPNHPIEESVARLFAVLALAQAKRLRRLRAGKIVARAKAASDALRLLRAGIEAFPEQLHSGLNLDGVLASIQVTDGLAAASPADALPPKQGRRVNWPFRLNVELLALTYARFQERWPTVTYDAPSGEYRGKFLQFALPHRATLPSRWWCFPTCLATPKRRSLINPEHAKSRPSSRI